VQGRGAAAARMACVLALPPLLVINNAALALFIGGAVALLARQPPFACSGALSNASLQLAIILLGLGLNLSTMLTLSLSYAWLVSLHVVMTLAAGLIIGKLLLVETATSKLIASGTSICGGTAVAALASTVRAQPRQLALTLAVVFILNACAVVVFPPVGRFLDLTELQFGIWSALAIHDTSSVLASAAAYGEEALNVATTIKLGRTLWLVPVLIAFACWEALRAAPRERVGGLTGLRVRIPGFVLPFLLAVTAGSILPLPQAVIATTGLLSKGLIVVALFFVGAGLTRDILGEIRGRVLMQALSLWCIMAPSILVAVLWVT
jgi:uncharacterized membrane protein YadS